MSELIDPLAIYSLSRRFKPTSPQVLLTGFEAWLNLTTTTVREDNICPKDLAIRVHTWYMTVVQAARERTAQ